MSAFLPNPNSVTSKRSIAVLPALVRLDATAVWPVQLLLLVLCLDVPSFKTRGVEESREALA